MVNTFLPPGGRGAATALVPGAAGDEAGGGQRQRQHPLLQLLLPRRPHPVRRSRPGGQGQARADPVPPALLDHLLRLLLHGYLQLSDLQDRDGHLP